MTVDCDGLGRKRRFVRNMVVLDLLVRIIAVCHCLDFSNAFVIPQTLHSLVGTFVIHPTQQSTSTTWRQPSDVPLTVRRLSPGFYCFSKSSQANFTECNRPTREPDLVSRGLSEYWDEGDYVVRYSHHWSAQHGIDLIKDSFWTIDATHEAKEFITGMCLYSEFEPRRKKKKRKKKNRRRG